MDHTAPTRTPLHPLLAARWSPYTYDPTRDLQPHQLRALLEAAVWAPSKANSQPWRFLVGRRGDATFKAIFDALAPENQVWAGNAAALVVGVAQTVSEAGHPNSHAAYDLGQAMAQLTVQATAEGLFVHQMARFDPDRVRAAFNIPAGFDPYAVAAIGYLGHPAELPDDLRKWEQAPRVRRPLRETAFAGAWGHPAVD
ncbi:oxidoreductase [Carbonactinospora thermoautotrophica]|uniref:nitroreductase family protein n=1 Tax=Carbonactinospora thermoautotrophica TaxID=1469144 RepID=UPI00226EFF92|nr:nitroreductase family protein [Carbonactinospora thermoautotrophica]MCX9191169.1 oxidoreductase [Carbonactinospora thermoautotrophica]